MSPTLSIVICTHNRYKWLRTCLESIVSQNCDPWTFEVVVVDNASTDATKDVALDFSRHTQKVRYVYECRPGVNRARNRAVGAANGRYIAYLDDDVTAHPGWCAAICQAFEQSAEARSGRVAALGGPIDLVFETRRPPWLTPKLERYYAALDLGKALRFFPPGWNPLGANMAFRREALENHAWDESLIMCDEGELFNRLTDDRYTYLYVPAMHVSHSVAVREVHRRMDFGTLSL